MPSELFSIAFDGEEQPDLYRDLVQLSVEVSDAYPSSFTLLLSTARQDDGTWRYLDEAFLRPWTAVTIQVGFGETGLEALFEGYVTAVRPVFESSETETTLEITGLDASVLMDREEKLKEWPNKKDSDIARDIFGSYALTPEIEDTSIVHDEEVSTVIQRETDYQFLRRLALRNGFDFYVEGTTAHFHPAPLADEPQPLLAAHFGAETTLRRFSASVDALRPAHVGMFQVDRLDKTVLTTLAAVPEAAPLGTLDAEALLAPGVEAAKVFVGKNAATGLPEMEALCQGLVREGAWFVHGEGEIDAAAYGHVLRPRGLVTIKGLGETYSGVYYVEHVQHAIDPAGYKQHFRVKRDALLPTGSENFESNGGLAGLL